jgi:superfamily II DNA or RNA helicase
VPVDVRTNQLPQLVRLKPEAELDLAAAGDTLVVTPGVTYMEPDGRVVARVRDGHCLTYGAAVPARDLGAESACWRELARFVPTDVPSLSLRGGEAVRFVASLGRFSGHVVGDGERQFTVEGDLHGTLSLSNDAADATFATSGFAGSTSKRADAAAVCAAWQAGDDVVRLDGGGFARLPADWLARYGDLVLDILAARTSAGGRPPRARLIAWAAAAADLPDSVDAGLRQLLAGLNDQGPLTTTVPLTVEPRPYQRLGIDWLLRRRAAGLGAILADDMGLGKTLQAIAAMPGDGRTLVVAPTSVLPNWQAELQRFRPELSVTLHHGGDRDTEAIAAGPGVVVTSYALLRLDADALARMTWDYVVFDEAHALKNADSQVAASAARLSAKARVGLTGTPVENRLEDLWSEMRVIAPGLFPSLAEFRERYSRRISQDDGGRAAERLRAVLQPFLLRRLKRDVAPELPQRTDAVLRLALSDEERRLYDALHATTKREALAKLGESDVLGALEALLRLRQACCHPSLVPGRHAASSSKVDTLVANLEELVADGHKALVFSQWTGLLDLIEPPLRDAGIAHLRLDGSTSDRGAIVDRFQSPAGPPVLIMSLKAGGVGLNLTAADHVFIMDPWWNPAAEDQAADRAHRIGQTRPVLVHRLVAHDTVEEKILVLQEKKRALADVATGVGATALTLTRDDIMALLQ